MRIYSLGIILVLAVSCVLSPPQVTRDSTYDPEADIKLFLSTDKQEIESEVLARLKQNNISNDQIKILLRERPRRGSGVSGALSDQKIEVNGKLFSFAIHAPVTLKQGETRPLIVILHGAGGSGATILPKWKERLGDDFIIVCPSYPMGAWWSANAEGLVLKLIREIQSVYPVDDNRVLLAGLSNGAIGAYMIGMFHPDRFAGILPIAGSITERYMHFLVNLKNTPIYMIQGQFDMFFPIEYSRRVHTILKDMKYPVVYREHEEKGRSHGGHFLPQGEIPAMVEWLKKQVRQPFPKVIRMTREENHLGRINWARLTKGNQLAALQIPGPEREPMNVHDGKIATLFAINKGNNQFEIMGKNLLAYELYLNSDMIDFNQPVIVTTQHIVDVDNKLIPGEMKTSFYNVVKKDPALLLMDFKERRDLEFLFDARIGISLENEIQTASIQ